MTRRISTLALSALTLAASAAAQTPDAGPDRTVLLGEAYQSEASVANRSPLFFYMADGDHATENDYLFYHSDTGLGVVPQGMTTGGTLYNWPSDMVLVGSDIFVIDTGKHQLYTLDVTTSIATDIGVPSTWMFMTSLAYDEGNDILYGVDGEDKRLLIFNTTNGNITISGDFINASQPYIFTKALAFEESSGLLYAYDVNTETIFTIDPNNKAVTAHVVDLPIGPNALYDEIQFFRGELYGSYRWEDAGGIWHARLRRIDLATGSVTNVGPAIDDISAHCLLVMSIPEEVTWTQLSGPGIVTFSDPMVVAPEITVSESGIYDLQLSVETTGGTVSDIVQITVNDVEFYCTGKLNSLGCTPFLSAIGFASATDTNAFRVVGNDVSPDQLGLFLYSFGGRGNLNFHGGKLCVKSPIVRLLPPKQAKATGSGLCTGTLKRNFNNRIQSGADPFLTVGASVTAQWQQRDPQDPAGWGDSFSNGIEFVISP